MLLRRYWYWQLQFIEYFGLHPFICPRTLCTPWNSQFSSTFAFGKLSQLLLFKLWTSISLSFSQVAKMLLMMTWWFVCFKFLSGNNDRNSEVKHVVYGVLTRYVRFLPHSYQSGVCMRTEVFGVKQTPSECGTYMYCCVFGIITLLLLLLSLLLLLLAFITIFIYLLILSSCAFDYFYRKCII